MFCPRWHAVMHKLFTFTFTNRPKSVSIKEPCKNRGAGSGALGCGAGSFEEPLNSGCRVEGCSAARPPPPTCDASHPATSPCIPLAPMLLHDHILIRVLRMLCPLRCSEIPDGCVLRMRSGASARTGRRCGRIGLGLLRGSMLL